MKRLLICLGLLLGLWSQAKGTEYIWTPDSTNFPYTLDGSFDGDTITISGTLVASGTAFRITTGNRVTIRGVGGNDRLIYGTSGGNNAYGVHVQDSNATIRDLMIAHDPGNNGITSDPHTDSDTGRSSVSGCTNIWLEGVTSPSIINCTLIVYGRDACNIDCYARSSRNIVIDSCNLWNETTRYMTRGNYGGASIRLECRAPYSTGDFSAHIYRSKVHRASHSGIVCFGNISTQQRGLEIAQCSVVVDARNDDPDAGQYGSTANCYGIITRFSNSPFSIHDNYLGAGTLHGGSRGITLENLNASSGDSARIYNNTFRQWAGPDAENPTGVYRGFRIRDIDGGIWDHIVITNNDMEVLLDTSSATTWLGNEAYGIQITYDGGTIGGAHARIDSNRVVMRPINTSPAYTGYFAACYSAANDNTWDGSKAPIMVRWNSFVSGVNVVWGTDKGNGYFADSMEIQACSLSFIDTLTDSGVTMSNARTWYMGGAKGSGKGNKAINCWYNTATVPKTATDTNITFFTSNTNDMNLIQRINISALGNNDSLVANAGFKVWNRQGLSGPQVVLDAPSVAAGDTLFDFRYWRTYGTGVGSDSNFNEYDVWVWSGSDTTKINDTTIDWRVTCLPVQLDSTSGTLPPDTCPAAFVPDSCPTVNRDSVPNGVTITDLTPNYVFDIADLTNDTVYYKILRDSFSPCTTVRFSGTVAAPASNITHTESGLADRTTYYWRIAYTDTVDVSTAGGCTETTSVYSYFVDTVKCPAAASVTPANGATVTADTVRPTCNFQTDDYSNIIVRFYGDAGDSTPNTIRYTDTLTTDSTGWNAFKWTGLVNGLTYFWFVSARDPDCTDSSDVKRFNVVYTTGVIPVIEIEGTEIEGITIGKAHENEKSSGTREVGWGASGMAAGADTRSRAYSGPACLAVSANAR